MIVAGYMIRDLIQTDHRNGVLAHFAQQR